ncbi:hypothetical protein Y032_0077g1108 [Ancylostoma ceylanicum]|uniref:Uncharacterized protein n=1 Tax=Ancylostoma ceylanicum TaxID=53326 RepID=A0A016TTY1_9BILA|nr:hypothetical protein Y032_0077g1108 [Ancylostoma ceylanicum]
MFFFVFRILLVLALLGAVLAGDPCSECTPRRPNGCCRGPSGTCCWTRKKRDAESNEDLEPIDFKPLDDVEPIDIKPLDDVEPIDFKPLEE